MRSSTVSLAILAMAAAAASLSAPVTYDLDPKHTFPSFEADHFGGMSVWRGKFTSSSGKIVLDREARSGTVDVTIDAASISTGVPDLDKHVKSNDFLDVEKFPQATYRGKFTKFGKDGSPTEVQGDLTLHGVTKPVKLTIKSFKCMQHPMMKKEFCGADAAATINRKDFGIAWGESYGFAMWVRLSIQVEAFAEKP